MDDVGQVVINLNKKVNPRKQLILKLGSVPRAEVTLH